MYRDSKVKRITMRWWSIFPAAVLVNSANSLSNIKIDRKTPHVITMARRIIVQEAAVTKSHQGKQQLPHIPPPLDPPLQDNPYDLAMIWAFRAVMGSQASWQSGARYFKESVPGESFSGLVDVARRLFARSEDETREKVSAVLRAFPTSPQFLRNNKLSCELLALLTPVLMKFLVGEATVEEWWVKGGGSDDDEAAEAEADHVGGGGGGGGGRVGAGIVGSSIDGTDGSSGGGNFNVRSTRRGETSVGVATTTTILARGGEREETTPPEPQVWRSKVVIERCRFLEASKCKGMCVGLCQGPTQDFFTNELGLPLRMTPDFETGKCEMVWGLRPEEEEDDDDGNVALASAAAATAAAAAPPPPPPPAATAAAAAAAATAGGSVPFASLPQVSTPSSMSSFSSSSPSPMSSLSSVSSMPLSTPSSHEDAGPSSSSEHATGIKKTSFFARAHKKRAAVGGGGSGGRSGSGGSYEKAASSVATPSSPPSTPSPATPRKSNRRRQHPTMAGQDLRCYAECSVMAAASAAASASTAAAAASASVRTPSSTSSSSSSLPPALSSSVPAVVFSGATATTAEVGASSLTANGGDREGAERRRRRKASSGDGGSSMGDGKANHPRPGLPSSSSCGLLASNMAISFSSPAPPKPVEKRVM